MIEERYLHSATLLDSGEVLVAGGRNTSNQIYTAEVFDPMLESWRTVGRMRWPVTGHQAQLLPSGNVMIREEWVYLADSES